MWALPTDSSPSENVQLLQHGILHGLQGKKLLYFGPLQRPQRNVYSSVWSTFSSFLSDLGVHRTLSHTFSPSPHCLTVFSPFSKVFVLRCHHLGLGLWGSTAPCSGFAGAAWSWLCPAWDSSSKPSHRGHLCSSLPQTPGHLHSIQTAIKMKHTLPPLLKSKNTRYYREQIK